MNTSTNLASVLATLGLDERAAAIYVAALELGESQQNQLAERAGLKRTTLRELLPGLLERGILQERVHGKRRRLLGRPPEVLVSDLEERAEAARQSLPLLLALENNRANKPEVRFFEGIEGVKQVFGETIRLGLPIYTFVDVSDLNPELERWLVNHYVPARHKNQITNYVLVSESPIVQQLIPSDRYRKNKIVPKEDFPFQMEIDVFGDYVSLVHFSRTDEPSATLIKSHSAATTLRSMHKFMWDHLEP